MKNHFKVIAFSCVAISMLSGCQKMGRDFWDGKWQVEKERKKAIERSEFCKQLLGISDYREKEDEYTQCLRSERDKYLNQ